jgi:regulator of protease activity HflC (stomatin/prohibitin superfamily)
MAEISNYGLLRHLRSEASFHVTRYRNGKIRQTGRGLAFWFRPDGASIAEIPMDDRDMPFLFKGRTRDFQEATVQGVITWRVADPAVLGERVDFAVDLDMGLYLREPLDQIATLLTGLARQQSAQYLAEHPVDGLLEKGLAPVQERIEQGLTGSERLRAMGLEVVTVRLADIAPTKELDRALQTPTFEALQQRADQATFERRALAVEKERAIAENELQNQIELARRKAQLIEQEDENARNRTRGAVEVKQIAADGEALRIRVVEQANADMEKARIDIYRELPQHTLIGLAAREFAGKLDRIEHLSITPDMLGTVLGDLAKAAARRLESDPAERLQ